MKKILTTLTLATVASLAMAQVSRVGTYAGDAFISGINVISNSGSVSVQWTGYETPSYGNTGWRVVVWDPSVSSYPIANEEVHATGYDSAYQRYYRVTPGQRVRVELYAVGDQYWNSNPVSTTVTTSMWIAPVDNAYYQPYANTNGALFSFARTTNMSLPFQTNFNAVFPFVTTNVGVPPFVQMASITP